jgi:hypothetical protein
MVALLAATAGCQAHHDAPAANKPRPSCAVGALRLSLTGTSGFGPPAIRHSVTVASFAVTNHGADACLVAGYVTPRRLLQLQIVLGGNLATGDDKPAKFLLPPSESVNFSLQYPAPGRGGCARPVPLRVVSFTDGLVWRGAQPRPLEVCRKGVARVGPLHSPVY